MFKTSDSYFRDNLQQDEKQPHAALWVNHFKGHKDTVHQASEHKVIVWCEETNDHYGAKCTDISAKQRKQ